MIQCSHKQKEVKIMRYKTNEIKIKENHAELIIYSADKKQRFTSYIDLEDVDYVKKHSWCIRSRKYVGRVKNGSNFLLHRALMDCPKDKIVDHINKNPLDNRKINLRICNYQENFFNSKKKSNNTSGVTGVGFDKKSSKWRARICIDYKNINLGFYDDKNEAIKARLQAEQKYFKEFAPQKHLFNKYDV